MHQTHLTEPQGIIKNLIENSISEKVFPGAVVCILTDKKVLYHEAFGYRWVKPKKTTDASHDGIRFSLADETDCHRNALHAVR